MYCWQPSQSLVWSVDWSTYLNVLVRAVISSGVRPAVSLQTSSFLPQASRADAGMRAAAEKAKVRRIASRREIGVVMMRSM